MRYDRFAHKFLIITIEIIVLILVNVFCVFEINRSYADTVPDYELRYNDYPSYSGVVTDIEKRPAVITFIPEEVTSTKTDSVTIGVESLDAATIRIGDRSFYANPSTYVCDHAVSDSCGNAVINKGQHLTVAYDSNDHIVAIRDTRPLISRITPYLLTSVIPSIVILIFTVVILNTRSGGLVVFSAIMIALSVICGSAYLITHRITLRHQAEAPRVRAHAPIIYLYNDSDEEISLKLDLNGKLTETYPEYNDGWTVTASPDGTLTDRSGNEYPFLFWEADLNMDYDLSRGFCVKGSDTETFLDDALDTLGLNNLEKSDFKTFWLPLMTNNEYNVITFQMTAYTNVAKIDAEPEPDVVIRINMLWYTSDEYVDIAPQDLTGLNPSLDERTGLVLSEWGGEMIRQPGK